MRHSEIIDLIKKNPDKELCFVIKINYAKSTLNSYFLFNKKVIKGVCTGFCKNQIVVRESITNLPFLIFIHDLKTVKFIEENTAFDNIESDQLE